MKTKKKLSILVFIVTILVSIFYLFLAPRPLSKEYQFNPVWKINTLTPAISDLPSDTQNIYFRLGQSLGYFTSDGAISLYKTFPAKASISNKYFALYTADANNTPFYNSKGEPCGVIKAAGYPYFIDDQIFVFLPGGSSFAKCDSTGNIVWRYEGTLPITAFSAKENYVAVGFTDGAIKVFETENGLCTVNFAPGGSDYPVILGLDISNDGKYIASVSGQDKQRFVLTQCEDSQPKIIYHTFLADCMPYRTLVHFSNDGKRVVYGFQNNIGLFDIENQVNNNVPVKSKLLSIDETENLIFVLGREKSEYTVYIIEKSNTIEGSFSFNAETAFVQTYGNDLFIGKDNTISRISITKE